MLAENIFSSKHMCNADTYVHRHHKSSIHPHNQDNYMTTSPIVLAEPIKNILTQASLKNGGRSKENLSFPFFLSYPPQPPLFSTLRYCSTTRFIYPTSLFFSRSIFQTLAESTGKRERERCAYSNHDKKDDSVSLFLRWYTHNSGMKCLFVP